MNMAANVVSRCAKPVALSGRQMRVIMKPALCQTQQHRSLARVRATDADGPMANVMTVEKAYEVLGVPTSSSFEAVVAAKNKLLEQGGDQDTMMQVEMAYDMLFMQNMKKRLTGELEVSTSVRYADVPSMPSRKSSSNAGPRPAGSSNPPPAMRAPTLPKLPPTPNLSFNLAVQQPKNSTLTATQAAIFGSLAAWALIGALFESPDAQLADVAGWQLGLALAYCTYSLKENKGMQLGKAFGVAFACMAAGALVGSGVESWLRVDIVPIGNFSSPGVLVSEFIIAACAAGAVLLV